MPAATYDLNDRLLDFATVVAGIVRCIPGDLVGDHVGGQLVRSGTAPAAHHAEALSAASRRDFVHRLRLALKELRETRIWLRIVERMHLVERPVDVVLDECEQLIAILAVSVKSATTRSPPRKMNE